MFYKIKDLYYNIKNGIKSLIKYFPIIWKMRDWDYAYLFEMQKFQLQLLLECLEKGHEIDETRIPKQIDIQRCINILDNLLKDEYMERCGFDYDRIKYKSIPSKNRPGCFEMINIHPNPQSKEEIRRIIKDSNELQQKELKELFNIIRKNCLGWWD